MRQSIAKKIRREQRAAAREALNAATRREVRWFARPRVFRAWALPVTAVVAVLVKLGWRSLAARWTATMKAVPRRGIRYVVRPG